MKKAVILDEISIDRKIKRLSYEIFERNLNIKKLLLVGIKRNGFFLAKLIQKELSEICKIKIDVTQVFVDKQKPFNECVIYNNNIETYRNTSMIVIDDVCSTGKTMMYVVSSLISKFTNKISTLVLVDRKHHNFPIKTNYVGIEVSTTLRQFIEVDLEANKVAYLF
ncbi:phosphoribosyltransferase family protein [Bacteroidota bacterium]|nr:phosphoribosyltransferase family protein [Bacteroidota bacterium]